MEVVSRHFSSIDSTNSWAKEHLGEFDKNKIMIITADGQTAGRGQFNRKWVSPPEENIYATFVFFMDMGRADVVNIPQVLAISLIKVLGDLGVNAKIKWPNDILISGKKVGGILCETSTIENKLGVVLGIGINVNMEAAWFEKIDQPATSIAAEKGSYIQKEEFFQTFSEIFIGNLEFFLANGFSSFEETLRSLMHKAE
jgi:BirA family biotin operon repressor/biotin-[acetyl-CoA-carboxylase] ligase